MPRGERSQTWFPELVSDLRVSWRADLTWDAIIDLRKRLQERLDHILDSRGITPATVRCSDCGHEGPGARPVISVRAIILPLQRFGIEPEAYARRLDKAWAKHRALQQLDLYGEPVGTRSPADHVHAGQAPCPSGPQVTPIVRRFLFQEMIPLPNTRVACLVIALLFVAGCHSNRDQAPLTPVAQEIERRGYHAKESRIVAPTPWDI